MIPREVAEERVKERGRKRYPSTKDELMVNPFPEEKPVKKVRKRIKVRKVLPPIDF